MTTTVPIVFDEQLGLRRLREPITMGLPFPRGAVRALSQLRLVDAAGHPSRLQTAALAHWPDGSLKWVLLDFQVELEPGSGAACTLLVGEPGPDAVRDDPAIAVETVPEALRIETGAALYRLDRTTSQLDVQAWGGSHAASIVATGIWRLTDARGRRYEPHVHRAILEASGPVRTTIRVEGDFRGPRSLCEFVAWFSFFTGSAVARLALTLRNPRRARHPRNFWDLGDAGSIYIRDLSLELALGERGDRTVVWSPEPGIDLAQAREQNLELYQDSSGGENWRSQNHANRHHRVTMSFPGYRLCVGSTLHHGRRAQPLVGVCSARQGIGVALEHFWENFPKAIEVDGHALIVRLFPRQSADVHELQGGEQKTHVMYLSPLQTPADLNRLEWVRMPLVAHASPEWYAASGAIPYLAPQRDDPNKAYLELVAAAIEGTNSFEAKREISDEYGWRHFGDIYADHEAVYYRGRPPVISHYNNQYDAIHGAAVQFLRSGDARWFRMMDELARHVVDIDVYHTSEDRAAFNHGLFWHTNHYETAATATHRAYSRRVSPHGGGPCNEHCYTTGLLYHAYLTGSAPSRDTVVEIAQWIIDMDDGRRHLLGWIDSGPTGYASATASPLYHGPGRGPANGVTALLNAFTLTDEPRFLGKAEELIRRCIHPRDTIADLDLLDAERRWSYTVFLQALGRYLDFKVERQELDRMYSYARASLIRYARWMATHERPYLTRPERLEFPTETWSAQDMRKSDVFNFAAKHVTGEERERFHQRAAFFFSSSVTELLAASTRTLTRPVVILMGCGYMHACVGQHAVPAAEGDIEIDVGRPEPFYPQRERVKRKLQAVGAATLAASVVLALVLFGWIPAGH